MRTLYAIGEALIDFIPNVVNSELKDVTGFTRQVGGAPANVASTVARLGGQAHMITQLGQDAFGDIIVETLQQIGVGTSHIKRTDIANTALAFVSLKEDGQRDFSFYRKPSADMLYHPDNLEEIDVSSEDIMHFCSVDLIDSDMKQAHYKLIEKFEAQRGTIIFDPNVRLPLWKNAADCKKAINEFIPKANIVKVSDEELEFITGESSLEAGIQALFKGHVEAVIYTAGSNGASIYLKNGKHIYHEGFTVKAIDTTGAGDAFIGAVISRLLLAEDTPVTQQLEQDGAEILEFSNCVASTVTTKYGAIESIPTLEEVKQQLNKKTS